MSDTLASRADEDVRVIDVTSLSRGSRWQVVRELGIFEGRRLVRHPALLTGLALAIFASVTIGEYIRDLESLILTQVLLAWGTIIAVDLAVLRSRRRNTEELLCALPADEDVRTAGHLVSPVAASLVAVLSLGFGLVLGALGPGDAGMPSIPPLGFALMIVFGAGVVGVFAARWLPHVAFGYVAVVVTMYIQAELGDDPETVNRIRLAFLYLPREVLPGFTVPARHLTHVVYLLALTALVAAGALARRQLSRQVALALTAAAGIVVMTALMQVRPLPEDYVTAAAASLTNPDDFQTCQTIGGIEYCAYPEDAEFVPAWAATVEAVMRRVPANADVTVDRVTQRLLPLVDDRNCAQIGMLETLPRQISSRLTHDSVWPDDGLIHPGQGVEELGGCGGQEVNYFFLAVQTGSFAVGLQPTASENLRRCSADGQARSALALWLGAQAVDDAPTTMDHILSDDYLARFQHLDFWGASDTPDRAGWSMPPQWGTRFLRSDFRAARQLMDLPTEQVAQVVTANWQVLRDPSTSTSVFLEMAGASPTGSGPPEASTGPNACTA